MHLDIRRYVCAWIVRIQGMRMAARVLTAVIAFYQGIRFALAVALAILVAVGVGRIHGDRCRRMVYL